MRFLFYIFLGCITVISVKCSDLKGNKSPVMSDKEFELSEVKLKEKLSNKSTTYLDIFNQIKNLSPVLNKTKTVDDFVFEASYQTHLQLAILNNDSVIPDAKISASVLNKANDYNNLHYIKFSLENKNFKSELLRYNVQTSDEYSQRISYYSFSVKNDIYLIQNENDTIKNAFVTFERTFDMSPKLNMTLVFENKSNIPINKLTLVYNDIIFNNGKLNFEFDYKKIAHFNTPEIKKIIL